MSRPKLMIPGPVDIPEDVQQAMAVPPMPHYGRDWIRLYGETQEMVRQIFGTHNDLFLMPGPGTMALEAGLTSTLKPGDSVLVPLNGFFAERIVALARGRGLVVVTVPAPLGEPVLPADVDAVLDEHPEVKALIVVHHETSTGVLNPLEPIAEVARRRDRLLIVDGISSVGGVPLPVDAWGVDVCVSVANKALETPPGLALISVSPRAWAMMEDEDAAHGWYLNLRTWRWYAENWGDWHPTPVTMPTSNVYALHLSLQQLLEEGMEVRYAAYERAARAVREGLLALDFPAFVTNPDYASPLTTAFRMRPGVDAAALQRWLLEVSGVMISGGIGDLRGEILRVGHIGQARKWDYVVSFLLGIEDYLRRHGESVARGASLVALDDFNL